MEGPTVGTQRVAESRSRLSESQAYYPTAQFLHSLSKSLSPKDPATFQRRAAKFEARVSNA